MTNYYIVLMIEIGIVVFLAGAVFGQWLGRNTPREIRVGDTRMIHGRTHMLASLEYNGKEVREKWVTEQEAKKQCRT